MFNLFQQPQTRSPRSYEDLVAPPRKRRWYSDFDDIFGRGENTHQHHHLQQQQRRKRLRMEKQIYQEQLRQQERERQRRMRQQQEEALYQQQLEEKQYRQQLEEQQYRKQMEEEYYRQLELEEQKKREYRQNLMRKLEQKKRQQAIQQQQREAYLKQQEEKEQLEKEQEQEYENDGSVLPFWKDFLNGVNQPATPTETEVPRMEDEQVQKTSEVKMTDEKEEEFDDNNLETESNTSETSVSSIYSNEDIKVIDAIRRMGEKVSAIKLPEGEEITSAEYYKIDGSLTALLVNLDNLDISEETRSLRRIIMKKINVKLEKLDTLKKKN